MKRLIILSTILAVGVSLAGWRGRFDEQFAQLFRTTEWTPAELAPVAWYELENTSNDSSGNALNGTWVSGAKYATGKVGIASDHDGTNYITKSSTSALCLSPHGTIALWINPRSATQNGNYVGLVSKSIGGLRTQTSYSFHWRFNSHIRINISDATNITDADCPLPPVATWTHLSATWDGSFVIIYTNGVQCASVAQTATPQINAAHPVEIGGRAFGSFSSSVPFDGLIDDVVLINRALTPTEITKIYNESVDRNGAAW